MENNQLNRFLGVVLVLILLTLNITNVVTFTDSIKFNMAVSDAFIPLFLVLSLFLVKIYGFKQVYRYTVVWVILVVWIIFVAIIAMKNTSIIDAGWMGLIEELVKTGLCILYFFVGYNSLKVLNLRTFKRTWSVSTLIFIIGGFAIYMLAMKELLLWNNDPKYLRMFMGTDTDPNHAATFLTLSFFGMGIFAMIFKQNKSYVYSYVMMFISIVGLIFTGSRGGLIGFAFGVLVLLCYYMYKNWRVALALFLVLILMTMVFFTVDQMFLDSAFTQRLLYKIESIESGIDIRVNLGRVALLMGADHPIFGVGRGNYVLNSSQYFNKIGVEYIENIPHNTYFGLVAETGIFGFLLFCMPLFLVLYTLYERYKHNPLLLKDEMSILVWLSAGAFALSVQAFVLNIENRRFLWYLAGVLIFIFENNSIIITSHAKPIKIKHLHLGLFGLVLIISIISIFNVLNVHIPYRLQKVENNYSYELPYEKFDTGESYSLGIKLSIDQNKGKVDRVILKIVEQSELGTKKVLDIYSYIGARGVVVHKFSPTMKNSKIFLEVQKIDPSLENYYILPMYLKENNNVIELNQWYFMQPKSIRYKTLLENKLDYEEWVQKTDLSIGMKSSFEKQVGLEAIGVEQKDELNTEVTLKVNVLEDITLNFIPFLYGYPYDLHVLSENSIASGLEGYRLLTPVETSKWKVGETHKLTFIIPRQHGIYELKLGFYHILSDKTVYLNVDSEKVLKTNLLNLGWLNLDSFTEGIIYE